MRADTSSYLTRGPRLSERRGGSSPFVDRARDRGNQADRRKMAPPDGAAVDPCPAAPRRCVGIRPFRRAAQAVADRVDPWSEWSPVEKSYFVQLLVIANVVFPLVFASRLRAILAQPSVLSTAWNVFLPYLFFGFYQEVVYRGILQSELVRRWGALIGILSANLFYTFGPSTGTTLRRKVRSQCRCSQRSSRPVCSSEFSSGDPAISGSWPSFTESGTPISSVASRQRARLDGVVGKSVRSACADDLSICHGYAMTLSKRTSLGISLGAIVLYWIYQIVSQQPGRAVASTFLGVGLAHCAQQDHRPGRNFPAAPPGGRRV